MMFKPNTAAQSTTKTPKPRKAQSLADVLSTDHQLAIVGQSNPIMDELYACRELLNARYGSVHNLIQHTA
jgi:hypothetical protein